MTANYILCYGDPANGFSFIGPFTYHAEAREYAEAELHSETWWIAPIEQPEELK
jgi:hypothetical protein